MDFWIFRFRKARQTYSDLQNIVGNLDLWIMPYVQRGLRDLNRWHQYQTEGDHWRDRNCEPYGTRHSNQKKFSTKRIYMLPFAMRTKQNKKPKMENAFLFWRPSFRSKKKYIYIYFLRYHGHPDRSMETICKWKRYSTQNMKPKGGYTKKHTVFNVSLVASLSKAYFEYLKFVSYVLNCRVNSAIKDPMASLAWWLKRCVTALRASFIIL